MQLTARTGSGMYLDGASRPLYTVEALKNLVLRARKRLCIISSLEWLLPGELA
jgi:hypothetical protein